LGSRRNVPKGSIEATDGGTWHQVFLSKDATSAAQAAQRGFRLQFPFAFATPLSSGAPTIPNSKRWQGVEARSKREKRGDDLITVVVAKTWYRIRGGFRSLD
jgi:hypothetical protein